MEDLGDPISYLTLEKGADVFSADGERIGVVAAVQADEGSDIFDSIVLDRNSILPGGREEIPAEEIDEIYERGVVLSAGAEQSS